jgi:DNA-binding response OmpR family regulator
MSTTARPRILYANNECDSCEMFTEIFSFSEIDVACVSTIKEALKCANWIEFDAYLLGTPFDDGNGFDLCRSLRVLNPKTPIVFYSGNDSGTDRHEALLAGADAYVPKPDSDKVLSTITSLILIRRRNALHPFMSTANREFYNNLGVQAQESFYCDGRMY